MPLLFYYVVNKASCAICGTFSPQLLNGQTAQPWLAHVLFPVLEIENKNLSKLFNLGR